MFFPTITATLGYNLTVTLLLCAPPWVFTTLVAFAVTRYVLSLFCDGQRVHVILQTLRCNRRAVLPRGYSPVRGVGWVCDCVNHHEYRCTIHFTVSDTGSPLLTHDSKWDFPRFLMAQSTTAFIICIGWINSIFPRPPSKRAVIIAFVNAFGQLGSISGSYIWPKAWGPTYRYSCGICIAAYGLAIVMILAFRVRLKVLNEKTEKEEQERGLPKGYRYLL